MCSTCFEATIQACPEEIILPGLMANADYFWIITDKFGKKTQRLAPADADGKLHIDCSMFPAGTLNEYAGFFELEIRDGLNYLAPIAIPIGGKTFDCVLLQFASMDTDPMNPYNVIQ